ncbi:MAG: hypothetical protein ACKPKO_57910, partial [Candidatus Fonsibacter sp.]
MTDLSRSASVRQLLDTPAGFRQLVHTVSGDLGMILSINTSTLRLMRKTYTHMYTCTYTDMC